MKDTSAAEQPQLLPTHGCLEGPLGVEAETLSGVPLWAHVGLGLRKNPKRAHLFVSHLLGKHIPVEPPALPAAVYSLCKGRTVEGPAVVLGYAETATSLGFLVARELGLPYLASTRYPQGPVYGAFEEAHSHATSHVLTPEDPRLIEGARTVLLVDDELTTGTTVLATIRSLEEKAHHEHYKVVTLLDGRSREWYQRFKEEAARLGITVEVWAHTSAAVHLPQDILKRTEALQDSFQDLSQAIPQQQKRHQIFHHRVEGLDRVALGLLPEHLPAMERLARELAHSCPQEGSVLVLGAEELMSLPLLVAGELFKANPLVRSSSTTLSPALVAPQEDYPLRNGVTTVIEGVRRFAYNVEGFEHLVLIAPAYLNYRPMAERLARLAPVTFLELLAPPTLERTHHA